MVNVKTTLGSVHTWLLAACAAFMGLAAGGVSPAAASDLTEAPAAPIVVDEWAGHWLVRARATYLLMRDDIDRAHITPPGPFFPPNGTLPGTGADVSDQLIPELDISYFVTNNIGLEVICCTTKHDVKATGILGDTINAVTGTGRDLASTWAIPATILLQYHLHMGQLHPYVGAGPTYSWFLDEDVGRGLRPVASSVDVEDSWGFTLQAGVDVALGAKWFLNVDAKYMFLEPDVTWTGRGILAGRKLVAEDLQLDPWLLSVGLGYKF